MPRCTTLPLLLLGGLLNVYAQQFFPGKTPSAAEIVTRYAQSLPEDFSTLSGQQQLHQYIQTNASYADPDYHRNATELLTARGYEVEPHDITTKDGYILTALHILPKRTPEGSKTKTSPPVILQHGLLDQCATWTINEFASQNLASILSDQGYDVWLGNSRGSTWSMGHVSLTPDSATYWNFTFHQMAQYDIPALVDYVLENQFAKKQGGKKAAYQSLGYVGHSQGTLQMFVALQMHGAEFEKKIAHYAALAPVGLAKHMSSLLLDMLIHLRVDEVFRLFGLKSFFMSNALIRLAAAVACELTPTLCKNMLFLLTGGASGHANPYHNLNGTRLPVMSHNSPAGTSVKNMVHWAQLVREGKLQQFDYGRSGNLREYGQAEPPQYNLRRIGQWNEHEETPSSNLKISIYSGGLDVLADPQDVMYLIGELSSKLVTRVKHQVDFEHMDFTWGLNCKDTIYPLIVEDLKEALIIIPSDRKEEQLLYV